MTNKIHLYETSFHRIETLLKLSEDFTTHAFLLPELLAKTIRDLHRFNNNNLSYHSSVEIMDILNITCTEEEKELLNNIENALRKINEYQALTHSLPKDIFLSIVLKLQNYMSNLQG